ncbi:hypothetical protein GCM10010402_38080 [Actinomadura luteofluorescens]|uniref:hypothetical protein n=1 Tax=Actinomadura luteofluorescens TaxID=46163 RepID=UPI002164C85E|nr:hypothetical protein [Actinomadura glauciflava]MCR3745998.1 hypothetical protein [Actinomadura glauciflava]
MKTKNLDRHIVININVRAVVLATLVASAFWLGYVDVEGWGGASAQAGIISLVTLVVRGDQPTRTKGTKKR